MHGNELKILFLTFYASCQIIFLFILFLAVSFLHNLFQTLSTILSCLANTTVEKIFLATIFAFSWDIRIVILLCVKLAIYIFPPRTFSIYILHPLSHVELIFSLLTWDNYMYIKSITNYSYIFWKCFSVYILSFFFTVFSKKLIGYIKIFMFLFMALVHFCYLFGFIFYQ